MTAPAPPLSIVDWWTPGVYDMPADVYHGDPVPGGSLSSSGARKLLPPSCPALYRWEQDHGQPANRAFELGHAAHGEVLGSGPELVVVEAADWRTKAAREARDEARAAGAVPLLAAEYEQVRAMAAALRDHPDAAALFDASRGKPEQSLFWFDEAFEVWRRARYDWYPVRDGNRLIIPDYKTAVRADLGTLSRAVYSHGYHQQAGWYLDGANALGLGGDAEPAFVFVFQEKAPPYLVVVAELDPRALDAGRKRNEDALRVYAECTRTGRWPGYADSVVTLSLPPWAENAYLNGVS